MTFVLLEIGKGVGEVEVCLFKKAYNKRSDGCLYKSEFFLIF